MAEPIKISTLVVESKQFVFGNFDLMRHYLTVLFPLILLFGLINIVAENAGAQWVSLVTFLPSTYLYACFALAWHRASLQGADKAHKVHPLAPRAEDKKFMISFFLIVMAPVLAGGAIGGILGALSALGNVPVMAIAGILSLVAFLFFVAEVVRYSFKLPANSVGVSLTMAEARKASKGLVWRVMLAMMIASVVFMLGVLLYGFILGLGLASIMSGDQVSDVMAIFTGFLLSIPIHAAALVLAAINVTILSKAYQWGMQNNA